MAEREGATRCEYIVVGAGSAGCVIASRLSEDAEASVLLLEAGGPDEDPNIHATAGWPQTWQTEVDWAYMTESQEHAGEEPHYWPRGETLGGSSSINGMIYVRGHRSAYDSWAYEGNAGWDYESVLPLFLKSEDYEGGASEYHGVGGPLRVTRLRDRNPVPEAAIEACKELGFPYVEDFNGEHMEGVGCCDVTAADGARQSTAVAFLHPALDRPNLTTITRAAAQRLLFEGDRCVGVEYLHDGEVKQAWAEVEVVVSSGTIGSAQLLMLSGIGNAEDLQGLGIEVISHLPRVGQNLHDHLLVGVIFEAKQQIPEPNNNLLEAQMFAKSDSRLLGSSDPSDPPVLDPRYLSEPADVERLLVSVRTCRELGNTSAFDDWNAGNEVFPGPKATSDEDIKSYIRRAAATYNHQAGTCRMGIDGMAVVDPELRVYGVERLRVADASIMPSVTSGNTNAPTIMIGEKAADMMRAVQRQPGETARS